MTTPAGLYRSADLDDLHERVQTAVDTLWGLASICTDDKRKAHLLAKREGLSLTLDYLRKYTVRRVTS